MRATSVPTRVDTALSTFKAEQASRLDGTRQKPCEVGDPDIMFPVSEEQYDARGKRNVALDAAKAVCAGCWFQVECLDLALGRRERFGVWAGLTLREREAMRRKRYARSSGTPGTSARQDEALFGEELIA